MNVITLLTDYGIGEPHIAELKGVVLNICPAAALVDVTHSIENFDIRIGALFLAQVYSYFPRGTVHVAVVDPEVGGARRAIAIKTKNYFFVGPDNGLLLVAAEKDGIEKIVELSNKEYMLGKVAPTFHGRDVFAPVAAHIANGVALEKFGPVVSEPVRLKFDVAVVKKGHVEGQVISIDVFGNVRMNMTGEDMAAGGFKPGDKCEVAIETSLHEIPFVKTFSEVHVGEPLLVVSGSDLLEIAMNQGSAAKHFMCRVGQRVAVRKI